MNTAGRSGSGRGILKAVTAAAVALGAAGALALAWPGGPASAEADTPAASRPATTRPVDPSIVHASDRAGRSLNLTIDDGPDPVWTPKVLDVLERHHVKAVFCMIGPQAAAHPDLVRRVVAAGHRLCDHTVSHDTGMDHRPERYQEDQILPAQRMIERAGGAPVLYYRAPGGAFTPYSRALAARHGMRPLGWNIDSKDFEGGSVAAIEATVRGELDNGPTVLFHDGGGDRARTVEALDRLLPSLRQQGYGFGFPQH